MLTLAEILRNLKTYDEEPWDSQEPTIYAAEPWTSNSQALVAWSAPKGGLPDEAAKLGLMRLVDVRSALALLADRADLLTQDERVDELCSTLVARVLDLNARAARRRD